MNIYYTRGNPRMGFSLIRYHPASTVLNPENSFPIIQNFRSHPSSVRAADYVQSRRRLQPNIEPTSIWVNVPCWPGKPRPSPWHQWAKCWDYWSHQIKIKDCRDSQQYYESLFYCLWKKAALFLCPFLSLSLSHLFSGKRDDVYPPSKYTRTMKWCMR